MNLQQHWVDMEYAKLGSSCSGKGTCFECVSNTFLKRFGKHKTTMVAFLTFPKRSVNVTDYVTRWLSLCEKDYIDETETQKFQMG